MQKVAACTGRRVTGSAGANEVRGCAQAGARCAGCAAKAQPSVAVKPCLPARGLRAGAEHGLPGDAEMGQQGHEWRAVTGGPPYKPGGAPTANDGSGVDTACGQAEGSRSVSPAPTDRRTRPESLSPSQLLACARGGGAEERDSSALKAAEKQAFRGRPPPRGRRKARMAGDKVG